MPRAFWAGSSSSNDRGPDVSDERRWIVGLGNPGRKYAATRHNAGFWVLDAFADEHLFEDPRKKFQAIYREKRLPGKGGELVRVVLVQPQTYMNLSGNAVRDLLGYYREEVQGDLKDRVLVVHDDLDLPEGSLRFRPKGGSGGHNGIKSIIRDIGTERFGRLKVGIGRGGGAGLEEETGRRADVEAADYVLEKLDSSSKERFDRVAKEAAKMLSVWLESGMETCMNRYNAASRAPKAPQDGDGEGDARSADSERGGESEPSERRAT